MTVEQMLSGEEHEQLKAWEDLKTKNQSTVDIVAKHLNTMVQSGFEDVDVEFGMLVFLQGLLESGSKIYDCFYSGGHLLVHYSPPGTDAIIDFSIHIKSEE